MYSIENVRATDPEIAAAIEKEVKRQNDHIELIASENWTSKAVMAAAGSSMRLRLWRSREPRSCLDATTRTFSPIPALRLTLPLSSRSLSPAIH